MKRVNDKYDFLYRRSISAEEIRNVAFIGKYNVIVIDCFQYIGNIKRIVNFLKRFKKTVKAELENLQKKQKEYDEAKISLSLPNEHYDKFLKCKQELEELMRVAERNKLVGL